MTGRRQGQGKAVMPKSAGRRAGLGGLAFVGTAAALGAGAAGAKQVAARQAVRPVAVSATPQRAPIPASHRSRGKPAERTVQRFPAKLTIKVGWAPSPYPEPPPGVPTTGRYTYGKLTSPNRTCQRNRPLRLHIEYAPFNVPKPVVQDSGVKTDARGAWRTETAVITRLLRVTVVAHARRIGPGRICQGAESRTVKLAPQS